MAKIDGVQEVSLELLKPYENNAKIHSETQVKQIADSISEFGFLNPCLIDKDFNIIAGHGRVMAAKKLGMETVPCIFVEGLTEAQRRAYILADNRLTELGEWDDSLVSAELSKLKEDGFDIQLTGFDIDDIIFADDEDIQFEDDQENVVLEEPRIKQGEIWILGKHRLMCGDSTNYDDVARLCDGDVADLLETDPPYNVDVHNAKGDTIENDNLESEDFYNFLFSVFNIATCFLKDGGAYYVWHADSNGGQFRNALEENGLKVRQNLIWVKSHFNIGRQDYQWKHEPCLYGWKDGAAHYFIDMRSLSTVAEYNQVENLTKEELVKLLKTYQDDITTVQHEDKPVVDDLHPTMKPLSLIKKHIRNSSREGEIVLDLFGGSGTTLIACEQLDRRCYMMEYDPKYAERIIQRWEKETNEKAKVLK